MDTKAEMNARHKKERLEMYAAKTGCKIENYAAYESEMFARNLLLAESVFFVILAAWLAFV